jgi:dephospho-CoA kinase
MRRPQQDGPHKNHPQTRETGHMHTWHIGLTGGIGSGKSTVAELFQHHGAFLIDADAISRATTAAGGAAITPIRQTFGDRFIQPDGALDRNAMRELVFAQPDAKRQLEAIVHPLVLQQIQDSAAQAIHQQARVVLYDIPLLTESSHWRKRLQQVIVVDCDTDTQIARVMRRNQLAREAVEGIIASQATRQQRHAIADAVVQNGSNITLERLRAQVQALARHFHLIIGPKGNAA